MTSFINPNHQSSSSISEGSSAPPSPASSIHCTRSTASFPYSNAGSPGLHSAHSVPRYGTLIPNRVFVGGISASTTEADLQERFSYFGGIKDIKIIRDRGGICRGYGFITFDSEEAAKRAQTEQESIVLKERRLNIAPAVVKQPFSRPYDLTPTGTLMYHNGASYAFDNGMAFFTSPTPAQSPYTARETAMYSSPFGPTQSSPAAHAYSPVLYPYSPQSIAYMTSGQQYSYQPLSFEPYFKAPTPAASQYMYGPPASLNGSLNGPSQSSSPGYGQPHGPPSLPGPTGPSVPHGVPHTAQYYHAASAEMYYNGNAAHQQQLTSVYPLDGSQNQDDYCEMRERDNATPVVSLRKLQERGLEELEITRTPKKPGGGGGGATVTVSQYRSVYRSTAHMQQSQRPLRGMRHMPMSSMGGSSGNLSSGSSGGGRSGGRGGSCQHRPVPMMSSNMNQGGRGDHPGRPQHMQRRGSNLSRSSSRNSVGGGSNPNLASVSGSGGTPVSCRSPAPSVRSAASPTPPATSVSPSPPIDTKNVVEVEDVGGSGDAKVVRHHLPLSPPGTPVPAAKATGTDEGEVCQQMQALAM